MTLFLSCDPSSYPLQIADLQNVPTPDYILDLSKDRTQGKNPIRPRQPRPWLAISWKCCAAYSRIYKNREGTAYQGHCPRCARHIRVPIGEGGTDHRFFDAH